MKPSKSEGPSLGTKRVLLQRGLTLRECKNTADTERRYDIWETVKGNVISYFFYRKDRIRRYFLYLSILPLISVSGFGVSNEAERHIWCNL